MAILTADALEARKALNRLSIVLRHAAALGLDVNLQAADKAKALRNLRLEKIDGDVWTVPAENMKGRKGATEAFRVPLSAKAQCVIDLARAHARCGFLFPNTRGGMISDMTLSRHMERRGLDAPARLPHVAAQMAGRGDGPRTKWPRRCWRMWWMAAWCGPIGALTIWNSPRSWWGAGRIM